jgi:magnesium chelatase subunit D
MAERAKPRLAARLARALDDRQGLSLVALDEGAGPEERIPEALADRLAIHLDLSDIPLSDAPDLRIDTDAIVEARRILPRVTVPDSTVSDLAQVAFRLGITSLRAPLQALALARASAALAGETEVGEPDLLTAVELVLAPRATQFPEARPRTRRSPTRRRTTARMTATTPPTPTKTSPHPRRDDAGGRARHAAPGPARPDGGRPRRAQCRCRLRDGCREEGQPKGPSPAVPRRAARQRYARRPRGDPARRRAVAAAPPAATGQDDRLHVRMSDVRVRQFEERSDRAIIFVVDASGSAALARLAEAKGAIELLLGEAYARRDHVALVAFRGDGADILLPPTRSLVQTKRRLGQLPGGGGTPLASGLRAALELAELARARG